jgi:hypothetical protein
MSGLADPGAVVPGPVSAAGFDPHALWAIGTVALANRPRAAGDLHRYARTSIRE